MLVSQSYIQAVVPLIKMNRPENKRTTSILLTENCTVCSIFKANCM